MSVATAAVRSSANVARFAVVASYAVLGTLLCASRFVGLDRSYWHDEIVTVRDVVRGGPSEILAGSRVNHELFDLLTWATTWLLGESEIITRLWSVVPFVAGVLLVTVWLHVRVDPQSGLLFLLLATISPLLLDVSRQARGYGLGFFAMSALLVAALEADRLPRASATTAICCAGLVGTMTLPNFGVAFVATAAATGATQRSLRRPLIVGLSASAIVIATWYAPSYDILSEGSRQIFGRQIDLSGVLTAPFDRVLLPGFARDGMDQRPSPVLIPAVVLTLLVSSASPLLRQRRSAAILVAGVIGTVLTLWMTGTYTVARFLTFLLVPMLIIFATGLAAMLVRPTSRISVLRPALGGTVLASIVTLSIPPAWQITQLPREAHKEVALAVGKRATPVFAYMREPGDLRFYLDRPVTALHRPASVAALCRRPEPVILVVHVWRIPEVRIPCAARAKDQRFEQYARGGHIDVWFIRPA